MPILPAPAGGSALAGGDLPVVSETDVLAEFPDTHRKPSSAPIRDAFCIAYACGHITYQDIAARAAAQCDPLRATGDCLVTIALDHGVSKANGETDVSLRARMLADRDVVTPDAIVAAVNAILAPYTTLECQLLELELDGLFIHDGTVTEWDSFIGAEPRYPDRYYGSDSVENDGFFLMNNQASGAYPTNGYPRSFHLVIPQLDAVDADISFVVDAADLIMPIANGSDTSGSESDGSVATFVFSENQTADEIYHSIAGVVESIKGQGISWSAEVT